MECSNNQDAGVHLGQRNWSADIPETGVWAIRGAEWAAIGELDDVVFIDLVDLRFLVDRREDLLK